MRKIYLDNNATTPVHAEVLDAMFPFFREDFGNPSSTHWAGSKVRKAVNIAREQVASLVNCSPSEVVFTSGGSESVNTAIKGIAAGRRKDGFHIISTMVEHPAVFNSVRHLEKEGFRTTFLNVDGNGMLNTAELEAAIRDTTILISAMYANNETGVIFPIREIGEIAAAKGINFICDTVQAVGKVPINFRDLPVNAITVSGHKLHAPKGIGALIVRNGIRIPPLIHGGPQEKNRRAGTENVPGIVGLGKACEIAQNDLQNEIARIRSLRDSLERGILESIPEVKVNGHPEKRLPNTLNISFKGVYVEPLLAELDRNGIAVSAGSACSAESREVSRVLTAMGLDSATARGTIRFSLGRENTREDINQVLNLLPPLIERLRSERIARTV
ncbi:MAG: aminotransferase class V-fold PLP-dependent enzyme [Geobacteraceae bacterium]|nr:aminotransferase class V-fold PLP-dependent enzyme [Geobacteraceae bacterium]